MKSFNVAWTGTRPLIMSNSIMVDPQNEAVQRIKEISKKGSKKITDDDLSTIARLEWREAMYWRDGVGFYIPSENIEKCIREGASKCRLGKQAEAAVSVSEIEIPVKTAKSYPRDLDKLYEDPEYQFRKAVRVPPKTGARVMKVRPIIPTGWRIEFELFYDETVINQKDIIKAMEDAGFQIGLGNWRPKFGRFNVEILN